MPPTLTSLEQRDNAWLNGVLAPLKVKRLRLDSQVRVCSEEDFQAIIAWDWVDRLQYEKWLFDCEDYAMLFSARVAMRFGVKVPVVIDYQSGHGYNLALYSDGRVAVVEPQTDSVVFWEFRDEDMYALEGAYVLA
jgi:hypothetical protein